MLIDDLAGELVMSVCERGVPGGEGIEAAGVFVLVECAFRIPVDELVCSDRSRFQFS